MDSDFLIIGGGIAGVSAGARLAQHGTVTLLEAEASIGYHASGRSAALYEARYGKASTITLNMASRSDHDSLDGGVLTPRGLMMLAGPGEEELFQADVAHMELTPLSAEEARKIVPILNADHITGAAIQQDAWDIDTDRLLQTYARMLRANGQVVSRSKVAAITRISAGWEVQAGGETFTGRILLNAGGAWADRIAVMAGVAPLGLTPLRRSVARLPAPGGRDVRTWPMLLGAGETWYAKPDAGAWLVSPAEEGSVPEPHDAWPDDMVLAEGIARYQPFVTEEVTRVDSSWAGLRTFAPDRSLVLGPEPAEARFVWVAGQGGYGIQSSPAASQLVADLITGRTPDLDAATVAALSPARFR